MRILLQVFFLFAALTALASVKIVHQPRAHAVPGAAALAIDAEGILKRTLRFNYPKGSELTIVFIPRERPAAPLTRKGIQWFLQCHGDNLEEFCSAGGLRRLFSAMVAAGYSLPEPVQPDFLPPWVTAAFRELLLASKERERVFRGNRSALSLGALLERPEGMNLRAVLLMDPETLSPAEDRLYREVARMVLDTASARHLMHPLLTACAAGKAGIAQEAFEKEFAAAMKEKDFNAALIKAGRSWMWRENSPRPAEQLRGELQQLRSAFSMPELDEKGEPTKKILTLPLKEATPLFAKRPDGQQLARKVLLRLHELFQQDTRWSRSRFPEVSAIATTLARDPEYAAKLENFLDRMDEQLQKRQEQEAFLLRIEQENTSARLFFYYSLWEANRPPAAENPELVRWLEQQSK